MEREAYFEKWKFVWNNRIPYISVTDLENRHDVFAQGEDAEELMENFNNKSEGKFMEWFYDVGYDMAMDHPNMKMNEMDKRMLQRWKNKEARKKARKR